MAGNGLAGFGEAGALTFSPEESAAATAATEDLVQRFGDSKTKTVLDQQIRAAAEWADEQAKPWYKRTATWTWIIGGATLLGGGYWFYRSYRRTRHA